MNNFIKKLFDKKDGRIKLAATVVHDYRTKYTQGLVSCPFCGEVNEDRVNRSALVIARDYTEVDCQCGTCHSVWVDFYVNEKKPYGIFN